MINIFAYLAGNKRSFLWSGIFLLLSLAGLWAYKRNAEPQSLMLPAVTLEQVTGEPLTLTNLTGQPVVLNLWATWCGPCKRELPMMRDMAAQNPDVIFVFASQKESTSKVSNYLLEHGLELDYVLLDEKGELADAFQSRGLPTTLFFNTSGELVEARLGELNTVQLFNSVAALRN